MTDLLALAERVEKLTGPDREVDCEIAFASGAFDFKLRYGLEHCRVERGERRTDEWVEVHLVNKGRLCYTEPYLNYTASLEAAMTLVPEGWAWKLLHEPKHSGIFRVVMRHAAELAEVAPAYVVSRPTASLAICAAALRARSPLPPVEEK